MWEPECHQGSQLSIGLLSEEEEDQTREAELRLETQESRCWRSVASGHSARAMFALAVQKEAVWENWLLSESWLFIALLKV